MPRGHGIQDETMSSRWGQPVPRRRPSQRGSAGAPSGRSPVSEFIPELARVPCPWPLLRSPGPQRVCLEQRLGLVVVLVPSPRPTPPPSALLPQAHLAVGPERAISGAGRRPGLGAPLSPCSCVPDPCESPSTRGLTWERVSARKLLVRQPESWKERVPSGQGQLPLESPPPCSPCPVASRSPP